MFLKNAGNLSKNLNLTDAAEKVFIIPGLSSGKRSAIMLQTSLDALDEKDISILDS